MMSNNPSSRQDRTDNHALVNVTDRPSQISQHEDKLLYACSERVDIGPSRLLSRPTQVYNSSKGCESLGNANNNNNNRSKPA